MASGAAMLQALHLLARQEPPMTPTSPLPGPVPGPTPTDAPSPYPIPLPGGEIGDEGCRLLGPFALAVQAAMGVIVVGSLVYKRRRERPMRPWKIWMLDVTKQMLGQGFVHSLNVFLSDWTSHHGTDRMNPCALYVLNIGVDTTLGVGFIYLAMRFLTHFLTDVAGIEGCVSGVYSTAPIVTALPPQSPSGSASGRPRLPRTRTRRRYRRGANQHAQKPRLSFWARQLAMYLFAMLLMKIAVLLLLSLLPFLVDLADDILALLGGHKRAELLFSLAIFPIIMNVLQFWLIDSLLRHDPNKSKYAADPDGQGGGSSDAMGHEGRPSEASDYFDGDSLDIERATGRERSSAGALYQQPSNQSEAHLVGDASDSEEDEAPSREARQPSGTTESHAYPPSSNGSASNSRAGSPRSDLRGASKKSAPTSSAAQEGVPRKIDGVATRLKTAEGTSSSRARQASIDNLRTQAGKALSDEGDPQDAWDAWDDIDKVPAEISATTAQDRRRDSNEVKMAMTSSQTASSLASPPSDTKRRD